MQSLTVVYFLQVPIGISLWFLIALWRAAELSGRQAILFGAWFIVAAFLQLFEWSPASWLVGLIAQVALAIVLFLKDRASSVY